MKKLILSARVKQEIQLVKDVEDRTPFIESFQDFPIGSSLEGSVRVETPNQADIRKWGVITLFSMQWLLAFLIGRMVGWNDGNVATFIAFLLSMVTNYCVWRGYPQ